MKYMVCRVLSIMLLTVSVIRTQQEDVEAITVSAAYEKAVDVLCVVLTPDEQAREITRTLQQDLEFTKQLSVKIIERTSMMSTKELQEAAQAYPFILFITVRTEDGLPSVEWRLYDADQATMLEGKRAVYKDGSRRDWIDHIADTVWHALMGMPGFFSTKIAYCKEVIKNGKRCTVICMRNAADTKGETERVLVDTPTVHIALRWNRDKEHPLLLYSECTRSNIRLCVVNEQGVQRVVSNFDGINMQASYAPDEQYVVVCLARNGQSDLYKFHFDAAKHKGVFEQLTPQNGSYFDPWWADNGCIYFSADVLHENEPSIGELDPATKQIRWITTQGYCTTPVYCSRTGMLAYLRRINGIMQVMTYNPMNGQHTQITSDAVAKSGCSWSPCGTYVAVATEDAKGRHIALCNINTGSLYTLTGSDQMCYHPAWAPFEWAL